MLKSASLLPEGQPYIQRWVKPNALKKNSPERATENPNLLILACKPKTPHHATIIVTGVPPFCLEHEALAANDLPGSRTIVIRIYGRYY
jgi:hypothetical protein